MPTQLDVDKPPAASSKDAQAKSFWLLPVLIGALAVGILVHAAVDPGLRDSEGFLTKSVFWRVSIGIVLAIVAGTISSQYRRFGFWIGLALAAQTASLQLIEAGKPVRYQHYIPIDRLLTDTHPVLLVILAGQCLCVLAAGHTLLLEAARWLVRNFKAWQLGLINLAFVASSATVSREVSRYVTELALAALVQALALANVFLAAQAFPREARSRLSKLWDRVLGGSREVLHFDRCALGGAVWTTLLAATLSWFVYERHPHVPDEVVYLLHSRYLGEGRLSLPAPPSERAFDIDLMYYDSERWFSPVVPGWPAMLAMGTFFGVPWLVNPLLSGLNVLLAFSFLKSLYDARVARLSVLLMSFSPWAIFLGMSFMPHPLTLSLALAGGLCLIRAQETGRALWAWLSGGFAGGVSLIRPLEGLVVAGLLGLWAIGLGGRRLTLVSLAGLVLGAAAVGSLVLPYNYHLTGDPLRHPIMMYSDKYFGPGTNDLGFGPNRGLGWGFDPNPGHSLYDAAINANLNCFSLNIELQGWCIGSALLIAYLIIAGPLRGSDYLMLAVILAVAGIHTFYYFSGGPDFGARYWYLVLVPCVALTARAISSLGARLDDSLPFIPEPAACLKASVIALSLFALVNYFPWRAMDKYFHYRGMRADIRSLADTYKFGKSLVLIRGKRHPDYASAAVYNPTDLHSANMPVYAWDKDAETRAEVLKCYPDRPIWIVNGPTVTGRGFEVAEGPLAASSLLAVKPSYGILVQHRGKAPEPESQSEQRAW